MKVFISSAISGYEADRDAVAAAITVLDARRLAPSGFAVSPSTRQQVGLAGVRDAEVVVLIACDPYGARQRSGMSPTEQEYPEARERVPVLVFVEAEVDRESARAQTEAGTTPAGPYCGMWWGSLTKAQWGGPPNGKVTVRRGGPCSVAADRASLRAVLDLLAGDVYSGLPNT